MWYAAPRGPAAAIPSPRASPAAARPTREQLCWWCRSAKNRLRNYLLPLVLVAVLVLDSRLLVQRHLCCHCVGLGCRQQPHILRQAQGATPAARTQPTAHHIVTMCVEQSHMSHPAAVSSSTARASCRAFHRLRGTHSQLPRSLDAVSKEPTRRHRQALRPAPRPLTHARPAPPRPTQPSTHSTSSAASLRRACLMAVRSVLFRL